MWLILSSISAIFIASKTLFDKKLGSGLDPFAGGAVTALGTTPVLFVIALFLGAFPNILHMPWHFWWPLIVIWVVIYPIQTYAYFRSLQVADFSVVIPVVSLLPVFNLFISWFLIGQAPSALGFLGVVTIVFAILVLLWPEGGWNSVRERNIIHGVMFMALFSLCVAFGSAFDKVATVSTSPIFYGFLNVAGSIFVLFFWSKVFFKPGKSRNFIKKNIPLIGAIGILNALGFTLYMFSIQTGYVSYVLAIRSTSILLATLAGVVMFRERLTRKKLLSLILVAIGIILLGFS